MTIFKIRTIYLVLYMAFATWRVFYNVYLEKEGFSGAQIGSLNAIMQATIFIVVAFWGVVADRRGIRPTLRIVVVVTAIILFFLGYLNEFWMLLIYIPILSVFFHPMGQLTDALALQFSEVEKKHSYGSLRLWGSLGWAIAAIVGGVVFSHISIDYIFPVASVLFILVIPLLTTRKRKRVYKPNFSQLGFKELLKNKELLLFSGVLLLYGFSCSPINSYLNLYFLELDSGNSTVGLAYAIMAFSELPLFIVGNNLLKKMGAKGVILIAMSTLLIRFFLYGVFPGIGLALVVGVLQGVSLAFFLVGAVDYLKKLMPSGRHATAQSIIWGAYVGVGQTLGNLFIGGLIDTTGMVGVMKLFIGITAICLLLTLMYFKRYSLKPE